MAKLKTPTDRIEPNQQLATDGTKHGGFDSGITQDNPRKRLD
mgnify:CR=1 FL=1